MSGEECDEGVEGSCSDKRSRGTSTGLGGVPEEEPRRDGGSEVNPPRMSRKIRDTTVATEVLVQ